MKYKVNDILIDKKGTDRVLITNKIGNKYYICKWWRNHSNEWGTEVEHNREWLEYNTELAEEAIIDQVLNKYK